MYGRTEIKQEGNEEKMRRKLLRELKDMIADRVRGHVVISYTDETLWIEIEGLSINFKWQSSAETRRLIDLEDTDGIYYVFMKDYQSFINCIYFKY